MLDFLLHDLLTRACSISPNNIVLIFQDQEMSYAELETLSNKVARFLIDSGVKTGDRIGILLPKCLESVVSIFGILKAGGAYVPIDCQMPRKLARSIISRCGIEIIITSSKQLKKILSGEDNLSLKDTKFILTDEPNKSENYSAQIISFRDLLNQTEPCFAPVHMTDVNPAYILFTSGSTGIPKGVVISHANALAFVNMAVRYFNINSEDRFASQAPFHFDLSVFDIYGAVKAAATIVLIPDYFTAFPERLVEYIHEKKVSIWNSASPVLAMLATKGKIERFSFSHLRLVHFSGDVLPLKYLTPIKKQIPQADFYNIYGQTEANSSLCFHVKEIPEGKFTQIPIGKPFPNFEVFALDDNGKVVTKPDQEGELYVVSSTVALGYWGESQMTQEKFVVDPRNKCAQVRAYRTGDIVKMDREGNYYFIGRKDHMVKSRGYRIELSEIENVIMSHPKVRQAALVAIPDDLVGNKLIAYIVTEKDAQLKSDDIIDYCCKHLPKYAIPESFEFRDFLPMTTTGKIDRPLLFNDASIKYKR
jgi:amino acid adenylation domain-containing protein